MRNHECTIYITTKRGWQQSYRKEKEEWIQTCPDGTRRVLSAEQLLSHILPLLVKGVDRAGIRVEPDEVNRRPR
jgi:hypothetical protein